MYKLINKKNSSSRGFTIVELVVVIVVIGILASITIVAYSGVTNSANKTSAQANATSVQKVAEAYNADNGQYPTTTLLNSYNGTTRIPTGLTVDTTAPTGTQADKTGAHILYKEKGTTGGCVVYWDAVANSIATKFTGNATTWTASTSTCG